MWCSQNKQWAARYARTASQNQSQWSNPVTYRYKKYLFYSIILHHCFNILETRNSTPILLHQNPWLRLAFLPFSSCPMSSSIATLPLDCKRKCIETIVFWLYYSIMLTWLHIGVQLSISCILLRIYHKLLPVNPCNKWALMGFNPDISRYGYPPLFDANGIVIVSPYKYDMCLILWAPYSEQVL